MEVTVSAIKWVAGGEESGAWSWPITSIYKDLILGVASEFALRDWQHTQEPSVKTICFLAGIIAV